MPMTQEELLRSVRQDQRSGAAQLALNALDGLCHWLDSGPVEPAVLEQLLLDLAAARPSMVPLGNAIQRCRQALAGHHGAEDIRSRARTVITSVRTDLARAGEQVARHAAQQIPEGACILTHSRSSQVVALFTLLARRRHPFSVICTQSSPGNEGFVLARELDTLGVEVSVITDAQMGLFAGRADLALCGCDSWLADGHFVNKSGTYLLALAARDRGKPLWVLADSFKDSPATSTTMTLEEMPPEEIGAPAGAHITTRNIYFESVPVHLVTGRISEQGVLAFTGTAEGADSGQKKAR